MTNDTLGILFVTGLGLLVLGRVLGYLSNRPFADRSVTISIREVLVAIMGLVILALVPVGFFLILNILNCILGDC